MVTQPHNSENHVEKKAVFRFLQPLGRVFGQNEAIISELLRKAYQDKAFRAFLLQYKHREWETCDDSKKQELSKKLDEIHRKHNTEYLLNGLYRAEKSFVLHDLLGNLNAESISKGFEQVVVELVASDIASASYSTGL